MTQDNTKLEHIKPGQLSVVLAGQLKAIGAKLHDKDLIAAMDRVEGIRRNFATEAMITGLMLLAKRETFPASNGKKKGSWKEYVETRIATSGNSCQRLPCETYRTVRYYVSIAKRLLWQIETRTWERPNNAGHFTDAQIDTLRSVSAETLLAKPESARDQISAIVSHRSLRQLLADFRKAEQLMEEEDREADAGKTAPAPIDPQQDFFYLLENDIQQIQLRRTQPDFLRQDKSVLIQYAQHLKTEAEKILAIVNGEVA